MALLRWFSRTTTRQRARNDEDIIVEEDSAVDSTHGGSTKRKRSDEAPATDSDDNGAHFPPEEPSTSRSKPKLQAHAQRGFNAEWLDQFDWLSFDKEAGKMFCTTCKSAAGKDRRLQINGFVTGASNFQRTALTRHMQSRDHMLSLATLKQKRLMGDILTRQTEEAQATESDSLTAQMRTASTMAIENIPDTKFLPLLRLQKLNGVQALQSESKWYKGNDTVAELQTALAHTCQDNMTARLQQSPYIGIMLDESIDVAIKKRLVIYFKLLVDCEPVMQFRVNCEVTDGKAHTIVTAVRQYLASIGIPMEKIIGMGTDGASVMVGNKNGVTTVLKRLNPQLVTTWCCAHRLSLMAHWAATGVPELTQVQATLVQIYKYFKYSPPRLNKLREMKRIMGEHVKKFKKPTAVRWLSLHEAVSAAQDSWGCLVLMLENQATSNEGESSTLALALLKEVKTYRFISILCLLCDVLQDLTSCSKSFQKDVLNIDECMNMLKPTLDSISTLPAQPGEHLGKLHDSLDTTHSYQGINFQASDRQRGQTRATCQRFVDGINKEAGKRFPDADMAMLKTLNTVLNPTLLPVAHKDIVTYGINDLEVLIQAFPLDAERARQCYRKFKFLLNNHRTKTLQAMCTEILKTYKDQYPDFAALASICLVIPLTSVPCERAFSVQNSVINSKRNRMSNQSLNNKMCIISESKMQMFDEDKVVTETTASFQTAKQRRK